MNKNTISVAESEWEEVKNSYPKLADLENDSGIFKSEGEIDIIDPSGILWRTFKVRIQIPLKYPNVLPSIYETGGQLQRVPDWHINIDGSCCVGPSSKVYRKLDFKLTLIRWLDLVVMPYFFDQVHKLETGDYAGKEYSHGKKGLIEDYMSWWNLNTPEEVIHKLKLITGEIKIQRNEKCFCGSNIKYKRCHLRSEFFDNIPLLVYKQDLKNIIAE
ncbi:MAG: SEC-C domain-containing protein [Bacteroidota bacterium]